MNRSEKVRAFYPIGSGLSRRIVALKFQNLPKPATALIPKIRALERE